MDIETRKSSRKKMLYGCGGCATVGLVGFIALAGYSVHWANTPEGKAKIVANKRAEAQAEKDAARQAVIDKARDKKAQAEGRAREDREKAQDEADRKAQEEQDRKNSVPTMGDEGTLTNGTASTPILIAVDEKAMSDLMDAAIAKDEVGARDLITAGRVFAVTPGTKAKLIDVSFSSGYRVRIETGPHTDDAGWVNNKTFQKN